ncbi:TPA: fimbrial protein [Escherichia albertii]|uniref:fimbrial protein n=1 Tax=Escherichia albertii TaxID=208962 RepID=UPI0007431C33|nr:fimbrial protein [Escherichia albertii]EEW3330187.1 type 1 fimbrial protein [Escherichia albertii]HEB1163538.1 type 1 fimbrial protein [Escherichia albertii]HEB1502206.1 type 1 fimbrial protein [Escherichia albertii]
MNHKKILKRVLCVFLSLSAVGYVHAEEISKSINVVFKVKVLKPVCKLSSGNQTIDFGNFDALDVVTGSNKVNGSTTFKFTECSAVNHLKIKFTQAGQNPAPDTANNYIPNQAGDTMAEGVAVRLLDESQQVIPLGDIMDIAMTAGQGTKELKLNARVIPVDRTGRTITPGLLQTAVGLEISYE